MSVEPTATFDAAWRSWGRLPRALRVATDGRKLILAALGLLLLRGGWSGLDRAFAAARPLAGEATARPADLYWTIEGGLRGGMGEAVAAPWFAAARPFVRLFDIGGGNAAFFHALLGALWATIVWGIVGGAIARIAAVEFATGERIGIGSALRFAVRKATALIGAPLTPLVGVAVFALPGAVLGLLYRIPGAAGETAAGVLAFVPLLLGVLLALILVGLAAGWPLMIASVAAEAEDGFDAVSRSYSYITQRTGRFAASVVVAWVLGSLGLVAALAFAGLVLRLAMWSLALGAPDAAVATAFGGLPLGPAGRAIPAEPIHAFWRSVVDLLATSWASSYFFSAAVVIYLLIRRDVDGTPTDDIDLPGDQPEPFAPPAPREPAEGG